MTNFEKFKNMTIDELAKFIDDNGMYDNTPWMNWWDKHYCDKCPSIKLTSEDAQSKLGVIPFLTETYECAYCEVYDRCKYFSELEGTPSVQDIIKMWLEAKHED